MTQENQEAAAAVIVAGKRAASNLTELHRRLAPCFARVEPWEQAGKYMAALMSELPRKNGWTIAEHIGDATPDRTQRLLTHDEQSAQGIVRSTVDYVVTPHEAIHCTERRRPSGVLDADLASEKVEAIPVLHAR